MAQKRLKAERENLAFDEPQEGASEGYANEEMPPSPKQVTLGLWFAKYKHTEIPKKAQASNRHWWKWINATVTQIDIEDAHAADIDFPRLTVNLSDPISVIGALKYCEKADQTPPEEKAVQMLLNGIHPYTVEDNLMLTPEQLNEAVRKVELDGYEIEWGSV